MNNDSDGDGAASGPRTGRWSLVRLISLLITAVSILAAIAAWRASVVSGSAGGLDQQATQQRVRVQQIEGEIDALITQDLRLFPRYLSHLENWRTLKTQARRAEKSEPDIAGHLRHDALEELALARTTYQALRVKPAFGAEDYGEQSSRDWLRQSNLDLADLEPAETLSLARAERERGVKLVGITALFIASLFFLTLAQVLRRALRKGFAALGLVLMLGASVAMVMVA